MKRRLRPPALLPVAGRTTTVLPLIETEVPNKSPAAPSDAVSLAVWVMLAQPEPGSVKT